MANYGDVTIELKNKDNKKENIDSLLLFLDENVYEENEQRYFIFKINKKGDIKIVDKSKLDKNEKGLIYVREIKIDSKYNDKKILGFEVKWGIPDFFLELLSKKFHLVGKFDMGYEMEHTIIGNFNNGKLIIEKEFFPEEIFHIQELLYTSKINKGRGNNINYKIFKRLYKAVSKGKGSILKKSILDDGETKLKIPRKMKKILNNPNMFYSKKTMINKILNSDLNSFSLAQLKNKSYSKLKKIERNTHEDIKVEDLPF